MDGRTDGQTDKKNRAERHDWGFDLGGPVKILLENRNIELVPFLLVRSFQLRSETCKMKF
jgi:hypothetical protein